MAVEPSVDQPFIEMPPDTEQPKLRRDGETVTIAWVENGLVKVSKTAPSTPGWDETTQRWVDWGDVKAFLDWCVEFGWVVVTENPKPDPIMGSVLTSTVELVDGLPVKVWSTRPKTQSEIDAELSAVLLEVRQEAIEELIQSLPDNIPLLKQAVETVESLKPRVDEFAPLLTPEQEVVKDELKTNASRELLKLRESIDKLAVLLGDNTTIGSYRQWKTSLSGTPTAAQLRSLTDLLIDQAQATRVLARQTLRVAKLITADYNSADVVSEA